MNGNVHRGHVGRYNLLRAYGARKREQLGGRKEPGGRPETMNSFTKPKFDRKKTRQHTQVRVFVSEHRARYVPKTSTSIVTQPGRKI